MNTPAPLFIPSLPTRKSVVLSLLFALAANVTVQAADGTWGSDSAGNWSDATRWSGGQIADGVGATANLTFDIAGGRSIAIDTAQGRTLGTLNIGDPGAAFNLYVLNAANGGKLTVNNSGQGAEINDISPSGSVTINAPIILADDLSVSNSGNATLSFGSGGGFTGTGNLVLMHNGGADGRINLTGAVNHSGAITNAGTGSAPGIGGTTVRSLDRNVLISGIVGSNITSVTQNSANTVMELSGANTAYTGSTRVYAGTLILGHASAAGSSQILVGDTSGSGDATLRLRQIANSNAIRVQAGGSGTATLGSANSFATTYSGSITLDKSAILSPYNARLTFNGLISGDGGIAVSGIGRLAGASGQEYGNSGAEVVLSRADNTNTFAGETEVLAGSLLLVGNATSGANLNSLLGTSTNAVRVGGTSGSEYARLAVQMAAANQSFSRDVVIQEGSGGVAGIGTANGSQNFAWSGDVALDRSAYLFAGGGGAPVTDFQGTVHKGTNAHGATSITMSGNTVAKMSGAGNDYDGGAVAGGNGGTLWASSAGSLGTGNALAETGVLRLDNETALASGKTVYVGPKGAVSLGANTDAQIAYLASVLDTNSSGGILLGLNITRAIDLASFGNGTMSLGGGGGQLAVSYSAASLGANADGNYHFGGANSLLSLTNGVLVGESAKVFVGSRENSFFGNALNSGYGNISLSAANTYGGGSEVFSYSTLRGKQQAASGSPFGSGPVTLHGGSVQLESAGGTTSTATTITTVGDLTFDGAASVSVQGPTSGGGTNTLEVGAITRRDRGILSLGILSSGTLGTTAFIKTNGTAPATVTAGVAGGGTVQMVAPYFVDGTFDTVANYAKNANFMNYDAVNGFQAITNAYTTLAGAPTNAIVKLTSATTIDSDQTIYALAISSPAGGFTITNTSGSDKTLTITSGGLNFDSRNTNHINFGGGTANTRINLDFAGQEAIFNITSGNTQGITVSGDIYNADGLTKAATGPLLLRGTGSTFVGDITLLNSGNYGYLSITNDLNLGGAGAALNNGVVFNGGKLLFDSANVTLNANRTLTIGTSGAILSTQIGGNQGATDITIDSKITGENGGFLALMNNMTNGNSNTVASTFRFTDTSNDFVAPISIGGAGFGAPVTLIFDADSQLGNAGNPVSLLGSNAVLRYAGSGAATSNRQINFLDMGGAIEVSEATGALTLGGTLSGSGVFNKLGNGRLALTGSNAYTGNTIVSSGVLNVSNAGGLGATTAAITGSRGVSGGGVYVQAGAALELQGGIAVGGVGGKTAYLNGNGIGNGGALRSLSGTNSNGGAIILQTDSTIGVDAGTLSLSGAVEGARLTKVGAGALVLTGSNSYTGGTVIAAGTLIANNGAGSATGSGGVSLAAGAVLGGAGRIGGTVTTGGVAATISPGNSPGTLTLGGLDASAGATFNFDLGSTSDLIDLGPGAFTGSSFDGGLVLNLSNAGDLTAGTYTLISFGSSADLDYSDFAVNLSLGGFSLDSGFGNNGFLITDHAFQVQIAPVPEANTLIFVLSGMGGLTLLRRRSRKGTAKI